MPPSTKQPRETPRSPAIVPAATAHTIYSGTSGWAYPSWKPGFYPAGLTPKRFLENYASRLNSVEVNYTFRTLPSATMLDGWLAATPEYFRFSFKAPQRITHFSRLRDCGVMAAEFVAALEPARAAGKLGPLLFQLPPNFKADSERLAEFLSAPAFTGPEPPRLAFEFRHESWFGEETYEILRAHNAALCIAEGDELITPEIQCAASFGCYRLRRSGGYSSEEIDAFVERFSVLAADREVYIYFKHEDEPTGAINAVAFLEACASRAGKL